MQKGSRGLGKTAVRVVLLTALVALLGPAPTSAGTTITVTTAVDELNLSGPNGNCSLREAVQAANTVTTVEA